MNRPHAPRLAVALSIAALLAGGCAANTKHGAQEAAAAPAAITPVSREGVALVRQDEVLRRARTGAAEVVFIGDSITQGWEGAPEAWKSLVGERAALNLGVGGDRTEHVLWRLEQAPLTRLSPRAVVLMIGTNNAGRDRGEDILAGIRAVAALIAQQCPSAQVIVLDIPPRGAGMNDARGKVAQVNQALSRGGWPERVRFVRVGDQFVRPDGSIDPEIMPDALHFSPAGYAMWAASIKPELERSLEQR
jgi:beta-glucosidase